MTAGTERTAGWRELLGAGNLGVVVLVCLGPWLHAADALLITTMMPAIVAEIGGERLVAWNFALYEVGSIVAGAAGGLVAMRAGLRLPMAAAALIFALGCAVAVASRSKLRAIRAAAACASDPAWPAVIAVCSSTSLKAAASRIGAMKLMPASSAKKRRTSFN